MDTVITVRLDPQTPDIDDVFRRCREITEEQRKIFDADDPLAETGIYNALSDSERLGSVSCSSALAALLVEASEVSALTGGAFSCGLRDAIELWRKAEKDQTPPDAEALAASVRAGSPSASVTDGKTELTGTGARIDLGGIAKGAAEQAVIDYLTTTGARYGVLSFGGNVAVFGEKPDGNPFSVAIRDPSDTSGTVGTVSLASGFVSVSGNYERYYDIGGGRYGHILDPSSGMPAQSDLLSVAVIAQSGALADALSTALFVMGYEKASEFAESGVLDFDAVFVTADGVFRTPGLEGTFVPD